MPTIFDLLSEDHDKVKALLAKVQDTSDGAEKTRAKLFAEIEQDLEIHTEFEENVFYPKARTATGMDDEIEDDLEEHAEAKEMLSKLSSMDPTSAEWMETIKELTQALEHHIKDEETKLFPEARKAIDDGEAKAMAEQYKGKKQKAA